MIQEFYPPLLMKFWNLWLLSTMHLNFWLRENKLVSSSERLWKIEHQTSWLFWMMSQLLILVMEQSSQKLLKINRLLNSKLKEQSIKLNRQFKIKRVQLSKLREKLDLQSFSVLLCRSLQHLLSCAELKQPVKLQPSWVRVVTRCIWMLRHCCWTWPTSLTKTWKSQPEEDMVENNNKTNPFNMAKKCKLVLSEKNYLK